MLSLPSSSPASHPTNPTSNRLVEYQSSLDYGRAGEITAARGDSRLAFISALKWQRVDLMVNEPSKESAFCDLKAEMNANRESPRAAVISRVRCCNPTRWRVSASCRLASLLDQLSLCEP